jgi:hypothetical protein
LRFHWLAVRRSRNQEVKILTNLEFTTGEHSMMKRNAHKFFKLLLPVSILGLGFALMMLFQRPIAAQITPQIIPRIDTIKPQESNIPPAYQLTISRPQDVVYVTCPGGYAPELNYLRNVKAIRCEEYETK